MTIDAGSHADAEPPSGRTDANDTASVTFAYDVFISYRHADGRRTARRLREWLRTYRPPAAARAERNDELRVYVDTFAGRVTPDFWEREIAPALRGSRFLVVVASPAAAVRAPAGSIDWMALEIRTFLELPQRENIIPVLTPENRSRALPADLVAAFPNVQVMDLGSRDGFVPLLPILESPGWLEFLRIAVAVRGVPSQHIETIFGEARRRVRRRLATVMSGGLASLAILTTIGLVALFNAIEATQTAASSDIGRALERSADAPDDAALLAARALHTVDRSTLISPFVAGERRRARSLLPQLALPDSIVQWTGGRIAQMDIAAAHRLVLVVTEAGRVQAYGIEDLKPKFDVALPSGLGPLARMKVAGDKIMVLATTGGISRLVVLDPAGRRLASHELAGATEITLVEGGELLSRARQTGETALIDPISLEPRVSLARPLPRIEAAVIVGDRLVTSTGEGGIGFYTQRIFDRRTGVEIGAGEISLQSGPEPSVDHGQGQLLRVGEDGRIYRRRTADGTTVGSPVPVVFGARPSSVVASADGRRAAVVRHGTRSGSGSIDFWDLSEAEPRLLRPPLNPAEPYYGPVFDPRGDRVAVALADGVRVVDFATGRTVTVAQGAVVNALAWSGIGDRLATAQFGGRVTEWDVREAAQLQTGVRHQEGFVKLAYLGDALFTAGHDGSLRRTAPTRPSTPATQYGDSVAPSMRQTAFSVVDDATSVAMTFDGRDVALCDVSGHCGWRRSFPSATTVASAGSGVLVVHTTGGGYRLLRTIDGGELFVAGQGIGISAPLGDWVFEIVPGKGSTKRDARSGMAICSQADAIPEVARAASAPNGRLVVAVAPDGETIAYDTRRCGIEWRRDLGVRSAHAVAFSSDSNLFAVGGAAGGAVFRARDGAAIGLAFDDRHVVNAIAFDQSGKRVLTAAVSRRVNLYDVERRALAVPPLDFDAIPWTVAFDPAGHRFAVGFFADRDGRFAVRLFDSVTGTQIGRPFLHGREVLQVAFVGQGGHLVTASIDGLVRIWSLPFESRSSTEIITALERLTGHSIDLESGTIAGLTRTGRSQLP